MKKLQLLFLVVIVLNCFSTSAQNKSEPYNVKNEVAKMRLARSEKENSLIGHELPNFALTLLNGKILNSESLKGKPTVINFWFIYCAPCIEEMPILNEIKNEFGNEVNFIAITYHTQKEIHEFLNYTDFNFIHIADGQDYIKKIGQIGYPKTLILDKNLVVKSIEKGIPKDPTSKKENKEIFKNSIVSQLQGLLVN